MKHRTLRFAGLLPLVLLSFYGQKANAEDIIIRNRTVRDPQTIYVALYQCGINNCDRAQGPFEVLVGASHTLPKEGDKAGFIRKLRWSTNSSDLKSTMKTNGEWDKVGGHENFGPAGNGYLTCNISDIDQKGVYESKTDTGEKFTKYWSDTWSSIWGPISAAGDKCQVFNQTDKTYYVSEYERTTAVTGSLNRLQGGSGTTWKIGPGQSLTFTKANLDPSYTSRSIRWLEHDDAPNAVDSNTWNGYVATKPDIKLVDKIYIQMDTDGYSRGRTTVELTAGASLVRELIKGAINAQKASAIISDLTSWIVPTSLLDTVQTDFSSEMGTATISNYLDSTLRPYVTPLVNKALPTKTADRVKQRVTNLVTHATDITNLLLDPNSADPANAKSIHDKLKQYGVLPDFEPGGTETDILSAGVSVSGSGSVTYKGQTIQLSLTIGYLYNPKTQTHNLYFSVGPGIMLTKSIGGEYGAGLSASIGVQNYWKQSANGVETFSLGVAGTDTVPLTRDFSYGIDFYLPMVKPADFDLLGVGVSLGLSKDKTTSNKVSNTFGVTFGYSHSWTLWHTP